MGRLKVSILVGAMLGIGTFVATLVGGLVIFFFEGFKLSMTEIIGLTWKGCAAVGALGAVIMFASSSGE
jgi:hypothetical protein